MLQTYLPHAQGQKLSWASLKGPDAQDFLQRVTTANLRELEIGQGAHGCLLNAQGKIQASFKLWKLGAEEFGFEYDPGKDERWKKSLFTAIDQLTFAEKMTLADEAELQSRWIFAANDAELETAIPNDARIRACRQGSSDFGRPWATLWGTADALAGLKPHPSCDDATLELWRIQALKPRVDFEIVEGAVPLELGMVEWIAPNKGCYPGQEVIEKIISLGSPAKRLVRIEGAGPAPARGSAILTASEPATEVATVTSAAQDGDRFVALAVVRKTHAKENLEILINSQKGKISAIAPYA